MSVRARVPRVKICGITDEADLDIAAAAGADAIGLITDVPVDTPREIDRDTARAIGDATPPFVDAVLVTMPETVDAARSLIDAVQPDAIQLHGTIPVDAIATLAAEITTIVATDVEETTRIEETTPVADAILLDSTDEAGAGGTGATHDWERARAIVDQLDTPVMLAGGLTPENVKAAVQDVRPYGVDVASGVAGQDPARKDPDAVQRFLAAARTSHAEVEAT